MNSNVRIYKTDEALAENLSGRLKEEINKSQNYFYFSVSGGNTPESFFSRLSLSPFNEDILWNKLQMFWCDERCVPPEDTESNYGMTKQLLLDHVGIPEENIHRIRGETNPNEEAIRYAKEIEKFVPLNDKKLPAFDWILLGLGEDGHTASIFPGQKFSLVYLNYCGVASHPKTGQKRISLTLDVINNAKKISFIVTGREKAKILSGIIKHLPDSNNYPASAIKAEDGILEWLIDEEASEFL